MADDPLQEIYFIIQNYKLTSSKLVNAELSKVIALMLRDFISSWFSTISNDKEFYGELLQTISYMTQELERRLGNIDWIGFLSFEVPMVLKQHLQDYRSCCSKMGTAYAGGQTMEELFYGCQPHVALQGKNSEIEYLRKVSELLMDSLVPENELQSDAARLFLRELICNNILLAVVNLLSEPVYLNELFLKLLSPSGADSPLSDGSKTGDHSDLSDTSHFTDLEIDIPDPIVSANPITKENLKRSNDQANSVLFKLKPQKSGFLKRKPKPTNNLAHGLNRFTQSGLEKVTHSLDRIKHLVNTNEKPSALRLDKKSTGSDLDLHDYSSDVDPNEFNGNRETKGFQSSPTKQDFPTLLPKEHTQSLEQLNLMENEPMQTSSNPKVTITNSNADSTEEGKLNTIVAAFQSVCEQIWRLHLETRKGPRQLGPINTLSYDNYNLESELLELAEEIFNFKESRTWLYVQFQYFVKPLIHRLGSHVINRAVIRGVYAIIREEALASYFLHMRLSLWPNDMPAPPDPIKTESEKERVKYLLDEVIANRLANRANPLLSKNDIIDKMGFIVRVFQHQKLNKHLLFILLDLILVHVLPESF